MNILRPLRVLVPLVVIGASLNTPASAAPTPAPSTGKVATVTGKGHCVRHQIRVLNNGPLNEGTLLQWLASGALCDANTAKPVWGLKSRAQLLLPPTNCPWPGRAVVDRTVRFGTDKPGHSGAVAYFESGDGRSAPPGVVGTAEGRPPTALGMCTGAWRVQVDTSVVESPAGRWIKVGTTTFDLNVGRHPQFDQSRPGRIIGNKTTKAKGHCIEQKFIRYGQPQATVGDLLEWISITRLCDGNGAAPVYGFGSDLTIRPPKGCPAPSWMTDGGQSSMSWTPSRAGATMAYYRYGDSYATAPPDWPADAGGGGAPGVIVVNCPGTWKVTHTTTISEDPNAMPSAPVAQSTFSFTVAPAS